MSYPEPRYTIRPPRLSQHLMIFAALLSIGLAGSLSYPVRAAEWQADLYGGGQVSVDPATNRGVVNKYGVQTHLWDGVHRLRDGSTLTVRSGVVVPNKGILAARRVPDVVVKTEDDEAWKGKPIIGYSPCQKLVRRVCGDAEECTGTRACSPAQQLLDMEWRERRASRSPSVMSHSSGQCLRADRDQIFFVSCGQAAAPVPRAPAKVATAPVGIAPCVELVDKVCGPRNACASGTGCDAARQLLHMARDEQSGFGNPADGYCMQGLQDQGFFPGCGRQGTAK